MDAPSWGLRVARSDDQEFLFQLNEATLREYVERVWGWDEAEQTTIFEERFDPERWQIIQSGGHDIGVLVVEEQTAEIILASIEILPEWQGQGIGSSVVRSLMDRAVAARKPLSLRVLHVNERARVLYERLGFRAADIRVGGDDGRAVVEAHALRSGLAKALHRTAQSGILAPR